MGNATIRTMSRQTLILLSILLLPVTLAVVPADIRGNPERTQQHIKALSAFGANEDGGVDRVAYSQPLSRAIRAASIRLFALSLLIASEM